MNLKYSAIVFVCVICVALGQKITFADEYSQIGRNKEPRNYNVQSTSSGNFRVQNNVQKATRSYTNAVEAIYGIGVRLQLLLEKSDSRRNFIVSPISVAVAVGELILGSTGRLRDFLTEAFITNSYERANSDIRQEDTDIPFKTAHQELGELVKYLSTEAISDVYDLKMATALFLQTDVLLTSQFEDGLKNLYNVRVVPTNFLMDPERSQKILNSWADVNTNGKIKSILSQPPPRSSIAILANSIYFNADWETPFSNEISKIGPFSISQRQQVNVTYLRGQLDIKFSKSSKLNCTMVELPYVGNKISMYLILPDENNGNEYDIGKFSTRLKSQDVDELIRESKNRSVVVVLPKMSLSSTFSILDPLKQYQRYKQLAIPSINLRNSFGDNVENKVDVYVKSPFSNVTYETRISASKEPLTLEGASPNSRFKLNDIVQQVSLAINEKGTEAAAITADLINYSGNIEKFRATRPFMFFIRHRETNAILFTGTIVNPIE